MTQPTFAPSPLRVEDERPDEEASSLGRRLASRRTAISLLITVAVLAAGIWRAPLDWHQAWLDIRGAALGWYLLAVVAYYTSFLLRAVRWRLLLRNTGEEVAYAPLAEILLASFFVNCVVPAKMGDLYRAVRLRTREGIGGAKALGTIVAERLLDLFVLMGLLLVAGAVTFRDSVPRQLVPGLIGGCVLCAVGIVALFVMASGRGGRVLAMFPERLVVRYESFRTGTVGAFGRWLEVIPLSVGVWALEGLRLGLVIVALGHLTEVGPAHFLLVALVAALLTTVPFLPGGLGLVEAGMLAVLSSISSLGRNDAFAIALLDRSISYGSLILVGGVIFLIVQARPVRTRVVTRASRVSR